MKRQKYNAKRVTVDGITFDSIAESKRWCELKLLEKAGEIRNLERQVTVPLVVNGTKICAIRPDYLYFENQKRIWEDCKGMITRDWAIKWKLAAALFPNVELRISGRKS
jgi:hypothetical protein